MRQGRRVWVVAAWLVWGAAGCTNGDADGNLRPVSGDTPILGGGPDLDIGGGGDGGGIVGGDDPLSTPPGAGGGGGDFCEEIFLRADRIVPDMLIVLDKSGSMEQQGRWEPSRQAVRSITSELDDAIRFGLMMFPRDGGGACSPGNLVVPMQAGAATEIARRVNRADSEGGTPTGETLAAALAEFRALQSVPDDTVPPQFVLLVTDGEPTCPYGEGTDTTPADVALANDAISELRAIGVTTYVIGYDTKDDARLSGVLDGFASRGGTGQHRAVENQDQLLTEFREIAGDIISCTYSLDEEPEDPSYVQVELDGQQINLNDPDGWTLNGRTVQVQGRACDTLQDGGQHTLGVQVRCSVVVPI